MKSILLLSFSVFITSVKADAGFILMTTTSDDTSVEVCSDFNLLFKAYPEDYDDSTGGMPVLDLYPNNGCDPPQDPALYRGKAVIMKRHKNCSFAQRGKYVQNAGGKSVIIVSEDGLTTPGASNASDYNEVNITVSLISNDSHAEFQSMIQQFGSENVFIYLYAPNVAYWNINEIIMWTLAVVTCALGALSQTSMYEAELIEKKASARENTPVDDEGKRKKREDQDITVVHALIFFGMCSVSILLMYFFYQYLVYAIIALFCIASCFASYDVIFNFFEKSPCFTRYRIPANNIPFLKSRPPILNIALFLGCAFFAVFWAVHRKEYYAWVLQDILGFMFCVNMIKQVRLPSYKISSILLILFFVYDIFYVFITPLLTPNKESIMVSIATGGDGKSQEELPMLFKLPRLGYSPYKKCGPLPYSLLGFGDVILPGLHIGYCAVWDYAISTTVRRHPYFIAGIIGYGIGLILTFVGMYLMAAGQPALLYLTPSCLISTLIVSIKRKELAAIWNGRVPVNKSSSHSSLDGADNPEAESFLSRRNSDVHMA